MLEVSLWIGNWITSLPFFNFVIKPCQAFRRWYGIAMSGFQVLSLASQHKPMKGFESLTSILKMNLIEVCHTSWSWWNNTLINNFILDFIIPQFPIFATPSNLIILISLNYIWIMFEKPGKTLHNWGNLFCNSVCTGQQLAPSR